MNRNEIDWRRLAEVATGVLGWTPDCFWTATPAEFWTSWDGWRLRHLGSDHADGVHPFGRADLAGLMARFPDRSG